MFSKFSGWFDVPFAEGNVKLDLGKLRSVLRFVHAQYSELPEHEYEEVLFKYLSEHLESVGIEKPSSLVCEYVHGLFWQEWEKYKDFFETSSEQPSNSEPSPSIPSLPETPGSGS